MSCLSSRVLFGHTYYVYIYIGLCFMCVRIYNLHIHAYTHLYLCSLYNHSGIRCIFIIFRLLRYKNSFTSPSLSCHVWHILLGFGLKPHGTALRSTRLQTLSSKSKPDSLGGQPAGSPWRVAGLEIVHYVIINRETWRKALVAVVGVVVDVGLVDNSTN